MATSLTRCPRYYGHILSARQNGHTFQEKRFKKNIIDLLGLDEQARKFGLKFVKPRKNQLQNRKLFFINPAAARSIT